MQDTQRAVAALVEEQENALADAVLRVGKDPGTTPPTWPPNSRIVREDWARLPFSTSWMAIVMYVLSLPCWSS